MKFTNRGIRYRALEVVELNSDDTIKVVKVTEEGDIILSVNGKKITLVELEQSMPKYMDMVL